MTEAAVRARDRRRPRGGRRRRGRIGGDRHGVALLGPAEVPRGDGDAVRRRERGRHAEALAGVDVDRRVPAVDGEELHHELLAHPIVGAEPRVKERLTQVEEDAPRVVDVQMALGDLVPVHGVELASDQRQPPVRASGSIGGVGLLHGRKPRRRPARVALREGGRRGPEAELPDEADRLRLDCGVQTDPGDVEALVRIESAKRDGRAGGGGRPPVVRVVDVDERAQLEARERGRGRARALRLGVGASRGRRDDSAPREMLAATVRARRRRRRRLQGRGMRLDDEG